MSEETILDLNDKLLEHLKQIVWQLFKFMYSVCL